MKGTIKLYFNAENLGKVRTRVENPSKELSAQLREAVQKSAVEVINANILDMRAKMIAKFSELGLTIKDAKHAAALANPLQPFFDVVVSLTPFNGDSAEDAEATADEANDVDAAATDEAEDAEKPESAESDDFDE